MKRNLILLLCLIGFSLLALASDSVAEDPEGKAQAEKKVPELKVSLKVPNPSWRVQIKEVWQVNKEIWVVALLWRSPGMAPMVIAAAEDTVKVPSLPKDLPVKYFIMGKSWKWENKEGYTFQHNRAELQPKLKNAKILYQQKSQK